MDHLVQRPAAPPAADRRSAEDQHEADPAAEVLRLFHDQELDLAQVARRTGIPRARVRAILRDAMPEQAQRPLTPSPGHCADLYHQGLSPLQIADRLQVPAQRIRTRLAQAGITLASRCEHPVERYADLANQGWSNEQIAAELDVAPDTVDRNLVQAAEQGVLDPRRPAPPADEHAERPYLAPLPPHRREAALRALQRAQADIQGGRPAHALGTLARARMLLLALESPDRYEATRCLHTMVRAHLVSGDLDQAEATGRAALAEADRYGAPHQQATVHVALADVAAHLTRALRLLRPTAHPDTGQIQARLDVLPTPGPAVSSRGSRPNSAS